MIGMTLYIFLIMSGFIIGLGAVTVIDIHGFFGRRSSYWTEATIRTHKITKPLIWIGMILATIGMMGLYWNSAWLLSQMILCGLLIVNGCFLSGVVSPQLCARERDGRAAELLPRRLQTQITISFVISFLGWWTSVVAFCLYIVG